MTALIDPIIMLIVFGVLLFILVALLSPLEALGWWAGWSQRQLEDTTTAVAARLADEAQESAAEASHYLVYLTAIGGISAEDISGRERHFLQKLRDRLPGAVIIEDVFPFSVNNNPLNGERQLAWLWQRIHNSRMRGRGSLLTALIFVRNLLQVGVSGDPRYGPIYNVGVAREIAQSLLEHGYQPGSGMPVTIMGWSGGAQIAIGVVRYLHQALEAPIYVVSIGGVMASDPSIADVAHLYHLQGSRDGFPTIGKILYPSRWPILPYSKWNQAERKGKITTLDPGPMRHTGRGDYFDVKTKLDDGTPYGNKTASIVAGIVAHARPETP